MRNKLLLIFLLLSQTAIIAQDGITVSGTVSDTEGQPLPGASVVVKGTTTGTQTDFDGVFTLNNVPSNGILTISYLGFVAQDIPVEGRNSISTSLLVDAQALDEVVVIGYGEMKSKDLTSAITTIKSDELAATPTGQAMQALQGKIAGLQVVSNGSPGQGPNVRVRGIGSYLGNASTPLYVVDGMFFNNIDFLNMADITSISILKDASAAAIYGVRAANGVVLIETKSGSYNKKPEFTYDGYSGYQVAQNVLKLANAEQFTTLALESGSDPDAQFILNAMQRYGRSRINPNVPNVNTDWYDEIIRLGVIQNHSIGVTGGGEGATYAIGANYFGQEGILKMKNEYQRFNLRAKLDFKVNDWLTMGANTVISNAVRYDPENSAWRTAYYAVPIMPIYDEALLADDLGVFPKNYANAQDLGYRGGQNPFPILDLNENRLKIKNILANFYAQVDIVPDKLTFKTSYSHNFETLESRQVRLPFFVGNNFKRDNATLVKRKTIVSNQIWDNTLSFSDSYGKHDLMVLLGTSYRNEAFDFIGATGLDFPLREESYFLDRSPTIPEESVIDGAGQEFGLSFFTRVTYNYDNRYLLYGTFRADGVRKFKKKWGYFPTIGAGWVVSKEKFMENNGVFDFLKLRGSWGQLGNDKVPSQSGAITSTLSLTALGDLPFNGLITSSDFSELDWELTEEINTGLTAHFLNNHLSLDVDYYIRDTKNAIIPVQRVLIPGSILQNVGEIRNTGFEVALSWNKKVSEDFSYSIGGNFASLRNEVLDLGDQLHLDAGTAEFRQRSIVGEPMFVFFGREITGVYQNDSEIQADPVAIANELEPGDFKYKDNNGDGDITDDDRKVLGSFLPSYSFGINVGFDYKGWDFSASSIGQGGNKILNRKRGEVIFTNDTNWDRDFAINRWHGEGTTNSYPSSAGVRKGWNQKLSDYWVEDGDFFRLQNITIGYTVNKKGDLKGIPRTRIYFTAEKPLTIFNYNGFNPEVANGVDNQTYPIPAVYTVGVNIKI